MPVDDQGSIPVSPQIPELIADPARQAVATITGYIYQIWWSVDAWFQLTSADELIYLEGAEDLDKVAAEHATTQQVKHESASISLNNQRAHKVLENFWTVSEKEKPRRVDFHYVSTASPALEQDADFGGLCGTEAWRVAQTSLAMAKTLQTYISTKLDASSRLHSFLASASPEEVQTQLIRRFHWFLEQPGIEEVMQSVSDRITLRLSQTNIPRSYVSRVRDRLYSYVSDAIRLPDSAARRLTAAALVHEIDAATTEFVAIPAAHHRQLLAAMNAGAFDIGDALLCHMRLPVPVPPSPLLERPQLVAQVRQFVAARKAVLLTGPIFKGKTTLAQLVANELCPDAWWFPVSLRSATETDSLIRAISAVVDQESTPSLIVIDDIDLSPSSHAAYRQSLALTVSRAVRSGRGLILTARGSSSSAARLSDFTTIESVDIPEMSIEEVTHHCVANGCPTDLGPIWATFIRATTGGHPKLVQVRIAEVTESGWPRPALTEAFTASPAIINAKHAARQFLSDSVTPKVAEFVYTLAEATFPLTRKMLLCLIDEIGELVNGGDIIDALQGKWLEGVLANRYRTTTILRGSASEVWLPDARRLAHRRLYDAIAGVRQLDVSDAAALLFHAFVSEDAARLGHCLHLLETIGNRDVSSAIYQQLMWVPLIASSPGQICFPPNPYVSALLRQLQFSVADALDSDSLVDILDRWIEEVDRLEADEPRQAMQTVLFSKVLTTRNPKIPLRRKLRAIESLSRQVGEIAEIANSGALRSMAEARASFGDIPDGTTPTQFFLSLQASAVRSLADLNSLLDWLELDSSPELRSDFEEVLHWPLVNSCGAFVHGSWSSRHEEETDWQPTIEVLNRANDVARRFGLVQFGSEVARASSIVRSEHMADHAGAMAVLDLARNAFGDTATISEQRVNALFQVQDYAGALKVWEPLVDNPEFARSLDAFAYRRAAMSACHLARWGDAERYFLAGAAVSPERGLAITKFAMTIDAAYVVAISGALKRGGRMLADLFLTIPPSASDEGNENWEALLRLTHSICEYMDNASLRGPPAERIVACGRISEPGLSFGAAQPGQAIRAELAVTQVGLLASRLGSVPESYRARLNQLRGSQFPLVRYSAYKATLAYSFSTGADADFVKLLAEFNQALTDLKTLKNDTQALESAQHTATPERSLIGEQGWIAPLTAAAICCNDKRTTLGNWRAAASSIWGQESATAADIADIANGLARTPEQAWDALRRRVQVTNGEAVGSALKLLESEDLPPRDLLSVQLFLSSAMLSSPQGVILQEDFGRPVARRFAPAWERLTTSPFLLLSPRTSVPAIREVVSAVNEGRAALKALFNMVVLAVGSGLGEVGSRLE